jgi:hypothetical protein
MTIAPWPRSKATPACAVPPGGDQVIHDQYSLPWRYGAHMHLDPVGAIFKRIVPSNHFAGKFAWLAQHDFTFGKSVRHGRGHNKAARLDSCNQVDLDRIYGRDHAVHRRTKARPVEEQSGNIPKQNPGGGVIRNSTDQLGEILIPCKLVHIVHCVKVDDKDPPVNGRAPPLKADSVSFAGTNQCPFAHCSRLIRSGSAQQSIADARFVADQPWLRGITFQLAPDAAGSNAKIFDIRFVPRPPHGPE